MPSWKTTDSSDLHLAEESPEFHFTETKDPTWREQIAHAQLLLSWRKSQGLAEDHAPRNPEPFTLD